MKTIVCILLLSISGAWAQFFSQTVAFQGTAAVENLRYNNIGWWRLNEGSGSIANDYSGKVSTGYFTNSPIWTSGVIGQSMGMSLTTTNFVQVPNTSSIFYGGNNAPVTVAGWLWLSNTSYSEYAAIVSHEDSATTYRSLAVLINAAANRCFAFYLGKSDGTSTFIDIDNGATSPKVPLNQWTHFACIYDGSTMYIYTNGVVGASKAGQSLNWGNATGPLFIGRSFSGVGRYFSGRVQDIRIWTNALSATQVKQLYGGGYGCQ
jgi:hypothetical protein